MTTADRLPTTGVSTAVYLNKQGERYAVYHVSATGKWSWEHAYSRAELRKCGVCSHKTRRGQ